jgi:hypothetical protein
MMKYLPRTIRLNRVIIVMSYIKIEVIYVEQLPAPTEGQN